MVPTIETRISRYQKWRNREPVDRPMVGILWEADIPPLPAMLTAVGLGNEILPVDIQPEIFLEQIDRRHQQDLAIPSDTIQAYTPAFGMPWVEAIAGCNVVAHPGSIWAGDILTGYENRPFLGFDPQNPWLASLVRFTREMVSFADGRFPIALPQMRGPMDTLAALRTPVQLCLDFVEQPQAVQLALDELTDLWIGVAQTLLELIPPYYGGYLTRMKMWAPGKAITPQNDVSTLVSPAMYRKHISPCDQKIFEHFPYSSFHMHSTEHHQIDNLLAQPRLTAIQFSLEHNAGGPPLDQMLEVCNHILTQKPLLLVAPDFESAEIAINRLPNPGLCVMIAFNKPVLPPEYGEWVARFVQ
jgi:hypothetical protein